MCPMAGVVAMRMRATCFPPSSAQALDDLRDCLFGLAAAEAQVAPQDLPEQDVGCGHQLRESNLSRPEVESFKRAGKRPGDPLRVLSSAVLGHFSNQGHTVFLREEADDRVAKTLVAVDSTAHRRRRIVLWNAA